MIFEEVKKNEKIINSNSTNKIGQIFEVPTNGFHKENKTIFVGDEQQTKSKLNEKEEIEENSPHQKMNNSFSSMSDSEIVLEQSNKKTMMKFANKFKSHDYIPKEHLGNLLEIYTFYKYFDDLLDGPIFELEELWSCIFYNGDNYLDLVQDMHMIIINMFLENLDTNKMRYESLAQKKSFSLLLMFYSGYLKDNLKEMILTVNWPDFFREILYVYKYKVANWEEVVQILESITVSSYNNTLIENKIKIFLALIKVAEELNTFKNFHSSKSERAQDLMKKKGEIQKLLIELKIKNQTYTEEVQEAEILLEKLETKKNEELNTMEKIDLHTLVKDIKRAKSSLNNLNRKLILNDGKKLKSEKKLTNILKELPFSIHPGIALGIDEDNNTFWIFSFHPEIIYKSNKEGFWTMFNEDKEELINVLDKKDKRQNSLKNQFLKFISFNIIDCKKIRGFEDLKFYLEDIFEYKSIYKAEERKIKTRKNLGSLLDKKMDSFYNFLVRFNLVEKCDEEFLKQLIFYLDEELMGYLNMREAFWIEEHLKTMDFHQVVNDLKNLKDLNSFVKQFEKNIAQISSYYLDEESNDEDNDEEDDKISKTKIQTIKIDDDNEEYQFKRRRGVNYMEIEDDDDEDEDIPKKQKSKKKNKNWKIKKSNLKFWNYHVQLLKKMWREFVPKNKTKSGIFFSLVIFGTILIRFISKKIDKLNEDEERERIKNEEEQEENRRLKKKSNQNSYKEFSRRKSRYTNRKKIKICKECQENAESEENVKCYSCENLFHKNCLKANSSQNYEYNNWRCSYCLTKIKNSRMTRKLRKELKYYGE